MRTLLLGLDAECLSEAQIARVRDLAPDARIAVTREREEMLAVLDDVEIAAGFVPGDLILEAPKLCWFQQWVAGADWLLRYPEAAEREFVLTNVSGIAAIPMSEHILGMLLAFARELPESCRAQMHREWLVERNEVVFELAGKTMLLIGVGAVGKRTARIAAVMGMRVLGVRRNPTLNVSSIEKMAGPECLPDVLPEADFVVLTVPLTQQTKGLIGRKELRRMKPTGYLVNIGRGGTVDERALAEALREKWIAGAALDVFEEEPLPEDSPLWELDNVIITAHYAGSTPHYHERAMAVFLDNLQRYQAGEHLRNVVDKGLGY